MSTRWINQSQPQSLVNATMLLYLNAILAVVFSDLMLPLKLAGIAGAYGIANEKKWGYIVSGVVAIIPLAFTISQIATYGLGAYNITDTLITLIFQVLLVALIFHPASRNYYRIWFK